MDTRKTMLAAVAATTAMTVFSFYLSRQKSDNFREPQLLAQLFLRSAPRIGPPAAKLSGWFVHYLVGYIFSLAYKRFRKPTGAGQSLLLYASVGALTGVLAILGWRLTLRLYGDPPLTTYRRFLGQLLTSHIIFALVAMYVLQSNRSLFLRSGKTQELRNSLT